MRSCNQRDDLLILGAVASLKENLVLSISFFIVWENISALDHTTWKDSSFQHLLSVLNGYISLLFGGDYSVHPYSSLADNIYLYE